MWSLELLARRGLLLAAVALAAGAVSACFRPLYGPTATGEPPPKRYKLALAVSESASSPIVDTATGRAVSSTLNADVTYTLTNFTGTETIAKGTASASASYERSAQRFADVRAARDAEIRAAKLLADQIKTRVALALVSKS